MIDTNVEDLIKTRRTVRKFTQKPVADDMLSGLVDSARFSASAANLQPLKYITVNDSKTNALIFPHLKWAGYLKGYTLSENERPTAYILVLCDKNIKSGSLPEADAGAAISNILLAAHAKGLGTCWMGAVDREAVKKIIGIPDNLHLMYVISLGYPAQESTAFDNTGDIKYFMDENGAIHVPKRPLNEILKHI